jgi:hypothetical protein
MTDTLPAFPSLARSFAAAYGLLESDYIAGMWKPYLPGDLLGAENDANALRGLSLSAHMKLLDVEPYVAPSWSWAHRGKVFFWVARQ